MDIASELHLESGRDYYPELEFLVEDDKVKIGLEGGDAVVTIEREDDRWTLSTAEWHGHFKEPGQAMNTVLNILTGYARTTNEFRGEKLSATWLETWDKDAFETSHGAYYLNPFDRGEWQLWPGERWRQKRFWRRIIDRKSTLEGVECPWENIELKVGQTLELEREADNPQIMRAEGVESWFSRFKNEFGAPISGMRWTHHNNRFLVFQVPEKWRLPNDADLREESDSVWQDPDNALSLVVRVFFRELSPKIFSGQVFNLPSSIEHGKLDVSTELPLDAIHDWTLMFSDGGQEMMAQVFLLKRPEVVADAETVRLLFDESLPQSRMGPVFDSE